MGGKKTSLGPNGMEWTSDELPPLKNGILIPGAEVWSGVLLSHILIHRLSFSGGSGLFYISFLKRKLSHEFPDPAASEAADVFHKLKIFAQHPLEMPQASYAQSVFSQMQQTSRAQETNIKLTAHPKKIFSHRQTVFLLETKR
ncbi:hypothetical protein AVEN_215416-1 [Araneus ventricosus]|uniref:Uncharacterized protein n=1 Tax=Araneus ventricosus TaxID=182803 RepID=A0A4Y2RNR7_ARAVE|nr:hypothetical protein AVEN_215416-1 [Araneus ventricosus]